MIKMKKKEGKKKRDIEKSDENINTYKSSIHTANCHSNAICICICNACAQICFTLTLPKSDIQYRNNGIHVYIQYIYE